MGTAMEVNTGRFPAETPAMLVIKSPAPDANDIPVDGVQLGWTVKQLKRHLTTVHPSKPQASKQRLIYAGRALLDHQRLSDVLRRFQPGITQHIHLVVAGAHTHKSAPTDRPGLRQRRGGTGAGAGSETPTTAPPPPANDGVTQSPRTPATSGAAPYTDQGSMSSDTTTAPTLPHHPSSPHTAQQLEALAVAAHQCAHYAQQCAAMGYPASVVAGYRDQAAYYSQWYDHVVATTASSPSLASPHGGLDASFAGTAVADAVRAVGHDDATGGVAPGEAVAEAEGAAAGARDGAVDGQFAQAGHGADAGFVDREEPVQRNQLTLGARILEQCALIMKLAFFMVYFGSHVTGWRYIALLILCLVTLLYQGGWIQRQQREDENEREQPVRQPDDANEGVHNRDEPAQEVGDESDEEDDESGQPDANGNDNEAARGDAGAPPPPPPPAGVASGENAAATVVPAPRPITQVLGNIVFKFVVSLVPGMLERQVP
eukprot:m.135999 g.135999  ORF g.135999 m.135999 type:complete len:487 (-) comp11426_c7_seq1:4438-5898(-)